MRNRPALSIALVGVMVLALLTLGPAASAKCVPGSRNCPTVVLARGTIEGPDIDRAAPIVFDDDDFWTVARRAGMVIHRPRGGAVAEPPGPATLGPRYRMDLRVRLSNGERFAASLDVYPHAPNTLFPGTATAWVRIPSGLMFVEAFDEFVGGGFQVEPGWFRSTSLHRTLVDLGLPETSAAQGGTSVGASSERAGGEGSTAATWALLAGLLVLLVGGALLGRGEAMAGGRVRPS